MESLIVKVVTLGCKVNQCESASIVATLKSKNINASEGLEPADVYILNTCSVTAEADKKSRQYLSKMRKINPTCNIIVVGCSSQNNANKFAQNNVIAIGGTSNKSDFALKSIKNITNTPEYNTISDRILYQNTGFDINMAGYCYEQYPKYERTRAFIKIQDGCNRFCSYCIIPYLRGRSRSRGIDDILKECKLNESKELVITGIDISAYGKDNGSSLAELLNALSGIPARKRLGSLECEAVTDEVLCAMKEGGYCPHFHLSLQSGSDIVLKSMNRRYDCEYYYSKVKLIRRYFPNAGITTDVIVGFPTETEDLFEESCRFIEKCAFSDIHVFPYSSRTGTLAHKKYKTLPPENVKARVNKLLEIKSRLKSAFLFDNLNTVASVYVEDFENGYNVGYTPNYIKVYSNAPCNDIHDIKLLKLYEDGVIGEPI